MKRIIRRAIVSTKIWQKVMIKWRFNKMNGYHINLHNPTTFNEKIQWIKMYGSLDRFAKYVDKYGVRGYIKEKIGEKYLTPLIGVYDHIDKINLDTLPNSFIIKATHGSGWFKVVKNKSDLDWSETKKEMQKWLKSNYFDISGEKNYKPLKGRIVVEHLIEETIGDFIEYKFYCYRGEPKYVQVILDKTFNKEKAFYDSEWNKIPMNVQDLPITNTVERPGNLNEMLQICKQLSKDFPFVRVDLFNTDKGILFGELTFSPGNGYSKFNDRKYDELFGEHLDITAY